MNRRSYVSNAILWGAAIISAALVGAPVIFTTVLLPSLAFSALMTTRPKSGTPCRLIESKYL